MGLAGLCEIAGPQHRWQREWANGGGDGGNLICERYPWTEVHTTVPEVGEAGFGLGCRMLTELCSIKANSTRKLVGFECC